ncbi:MAG: GRP family sugar transporter [Patescibacteria group bacterium]
MLLGYFAAIFSAIMWGSNNVPVRKAKGYDSFYFNFLMGVGIIIIGLIISIINQSFIFSWWGILTGTLWSFGNVLTIYAIKYIGIARSMTLLQGVIIPVSFFSGIAFFNELVQFWGLAIVSLILFGIGGYLLTKSEDQQNSQKIGQGLIFSLLAGLIFGFYGVPFRISEIAPQDFVFSVSLGIFLTSTAFYLIKYSKPSKKFIFPAVLAGSMWNLGNFSSFFAISILGLTLGYPLTQLAMFVNVMWGTLYFKEAKDTRAIVRIVIGSIILFSAAILLSLSK